MHHYACNKEEAGLQQFLEIPKIVENPEEKCCSLLVANNVL